MTGKYDNTHKDVHIALSPDAQVVVVSVGDTLHFYSAVTGTLDRTVSDIYSGCAITALLFDSTGKHILTAGQKHIRVFHNVTGYKCAIATAKDKLKQHQTSATKDRLESIVSESEAFLKTIGGE